jgi:NAD(P)-dependent dehydrogenase (short-subunit alcohol dehydrogenase family)
VGRLDGKLAFVTGGSGGIGTAIAEAFAGEGANVAIGAHTNAAGAATTLKKVQAKGSGGLVVAGDVSETSDAARMVSEAVSGLGGLDIVVNNAAFAIEDAQVLAADYNLDIWDRTIAVNLRGPYLIARNAIPHLLARGGGALLAIGSISGFQPWKGDCAYSVAKAGLHMLTKAIALEYAEAGIRSNCICPGVVETDGMARYFESTEGARDKFTRLHPANRLGRPDEIAALAVSLCSDESPFVTGALVPADGAYLLRQGEPERTNSPQVSA